MAVTGRFESITCRPNIAQKRTLPVRSSCDYYTSLRHSSAVTLQTAAIVCTSIRNSSRTSRSTMSKVLGG